MGPQRVTGVSLLGGVVKTMAGMCVFSPVSKGKAWVLVVERRGLKEAGSVVRPPLAQEGFGQLTELIE